MINIIDPHKNVSREVKEADIQRVEKIALEMIEFCKNPQGNFREILALAHQQVEKKDPLRFFVTEFNEIIINPVITRHTEVTIDSKEGCVSFPNESMITVQRWNKCEVKYQKIENSKLISCEEKLNGQRAKMFQHEIDHLDAKYIYELN